MAKINFYHLTKSPLGKALPKLLEKVIESDYRALVVASSDEKLEQLNKELWTYTTKYFLPHGTKKDGFSEKQPIFLTCANDNPNGAKVLAFVGDAEPFDLEKFEKCVYMFDGNDDNEMQIARSRWKEYKNSGYELTYWQQNKKGGWEEK